MELLSTVIILTFGICPTLILIIYFGYKRWHRCEREEEGYDCAGINCTCKRAKRLNK